MNYVFSLLTFLSSFNVFAVEAPKDPFAELKTALSDLNAAFAPFENKKTLSSKDEKAICEKINAVEKILIKDTNALMLFKVAERRYTEIYSKEDGSQYGKPIAAPKEKISELEDILRTFPPSMFLMLAAQGFHNRACTVENADNLTKNIRTYFFTLDQWKIKNVEIYPAKAH